MGEKEVDNNNFIVQGTLRRSFAYRLIPAFEEQCYRLLCRRRAHNWRTIVRRHLAVFPAFTNCPRPHYKGPVHYPHMHPQSSLFLALHLPPSILVTVFFDFLSL
jgi:hypothetical protein